MCRPPAQPPSTAQLPGTAHEHSGGNWALSRPDYSKLGFSGRVAGHCARLPPGSSSYTGTRGEGLCSQRDLPAFLANQREMEEKQKDREYVEQHAERSIQLPNFNALKPSRPH